MTVEDFKASRETTPDPDLLLFEFWQDGTTVYDRAVNNNEDVIFEGNTFTATSFDVQAPSAENNLSTVQLSISNVSRVAGRAVLNARGKIRCRMIWVNGDDYTVNVDGIREYASSFHDTSNMMVITNAETDVLTVSGDLMAKTDPLMGYPFTKTSEEFFPGLWIKR